MTFFSELRRKLGINKYKVEVRKEEEEQGGTMGTDAGTGTEGEVPGGGFEGIEKQGQESQKAAEKKRAEGEREVQEDAKRRASQKGGEPRKDDV